MNYPIGSGTSNRVDDEQQRQQGYGRSAEGQQQTGAGTSQQQSGSTGQQQTAGYGGSAGIGTSVGSNTRGSQVVGGTGTTGTQTGRSTTNVNYLDPRLFQQAANRYNTRADLSQQNAQRLLYGPQSYVRQSYTPPPPQSFGAGQTGGQAGGDIWSKLGLSPMQFPGNASGVGQPQMPAGFPSFQDLIAGIQQYAPWGGMTPGASQPPSAGGSPYPGLPGGVPSWWTQPPAGGGTTPPPPAGGGGGTVKPAPDIPPQPYEPPPTDTGVDQTGTAPPTGGGSTRPAPGDVMARTAAAPTESMGRFSAADEQAARAAAQAGATGAQPLPPEALAQVQQMLGDTGLQSAYQPGYGGGDQYLPAEQGGGTGGIMGSIEGLLGSTGYSPEERAAKQQAEMLSARTGADVAQQNILRTAARTGQSAGVAGALGDLGAQTAAKLSDQARQDTIENAQEQERRRELGLQAGQAQYGQELGAEQGATSGLANLAGMQSGTTQETQQTQEQLQQQIQQAVEQALQQGYTTNQEQQYSQQLQQQMQQAISRGDYATAQNLQRQLEQEQYNQGQRHSTEQANKKDYDNILGQLLGGAGGATGNLLNDLFKKLLGGGGTSGGSGGGGGGTGGGGGLINGLKSLLGGGGNGGANPRDVGWHDLIAGLRNDPQAAKAFLSNFTSPDMPSWWNPDAGLTPQAEQYLNDNLGVQWDAINNGYANGSINDSDINNPSWWDQMWPENPPEEYYGGGDYTGGELPPDFWDFLNPGSGGGGGFDPWGYSGGGYTGGGTEVPFDPFSDPNYDPFWTGYD